MVVVDSRRVPRVPRYSGACHEPNHFHVRGCHPLWPVFPDHSVSGSVDNSPALNRAGPTTPMNPKTHRFGLFRVRSPLLTKSLNCFLFLQVLRWFTSLSSLLETYGFSFQILHFQRSGLPHSEIFGSTPVCGFPKLIAADHVLHRLPSPRHPPCALSSLIITCLWRSLCFLASGHPPDRFGTSLRDLLTTVGSPHALICRVCPSIFNCQRPQRSEKTAMLSRMRIG